MDFNISSGILNAHSFFTILFSLQIGAVSLHLSEVEDNKMRSCSSRAFGIDSMEGFFYLSKFNDNKLGTSVNHSWFSSFLLGLAFFLFLSSLPRSSFLASSIFSFLVTSVPIFLSPSLPHLIIFHIYCLFRLFQLSLQIHHLALPALWFSAPNLSLELLRAFSVRWWLCVTFTGIYQFLRKTNFFIIIIINEE